MNIAVRVVNRIKRFINKRTPIIKHWLEVQKRKKLSIFDYEKLSESMELNTVDYFANAYYGNASIIKKIEGIPRWKRLEAGVEHGVGYVDEDIWEFLKQFQRIYVFGNLRCRIMKEKYPDKDIRTHGVFIQNVKRGVLPDRKVKSLKEELGKTLLVFPTHSAEFFIDSFDQSPLVELIEKTKEEHGFDTVLVSVYWKDIQLGRAKIYEDAGYTVVSAGHIYDMTFYRRLKSILALADVVMTNGFGSHLGYAIVEKKPVYFHYFKAAFKCLNGQFTDQQTAEYNDTYGLRLANDTCTQLFGEYSETITQEQREFVREYWGDFDY